MEFWSHLAALLQKHWLQYKWRNKSNFIVLIILPVQIVFMAWMIQWLLATNYFTKHVPREMHSFSELSPLSPTCSELSYSFSHSQPSTSVDKMKHYISETLVPYLRKEYHLEVQPSTPVMRSFPTLCANLDFRLETTENASLIIMSIQQKVINADLVNINALRNYNQTEEFIPMHMPALQLLLQQSFVKTNPSSLPLKPSYQITVHTQPFDRREEQDDFNPFAWNVSLSLFIVNAMLPIYLFANIMSMIQNNAFLLPVSEREKKLESRLEMIGCNMIAYNSSWAIFALIDVWLCITLTSILLFALGLMQFTNFFLFYFVYVLGAVCCIPLLLSCNYWFGTVKMATTFSSLTLTLFIPIWILVNRVTYFVGQMGTLPPWLLQCITNLFPPFAFLDFMLYSSSVEYYSTKQQQPENYVYFSWSNMFTTNVATIDMHFNLFICLFSLLINSVLYQFLHLYISRIIPRQYGIPERWNYIFKRDFWNAFFVSSLKNPVEEMNSIEDLELQQSQELQMGVQLKHIYKTYTSGVLWNKKSTVAVDGLSLTISQNQIFGLLGANGSGKTTTCNLIAGVISASYGQVMINNQFNIVNHINAIRKLIGYVPQEDVMFDKLNAYEHLRLFATIKGVHRSAMQQQITEELERVGLIEHQHKMVTHFSGGMKRRLNFALAMVGNPKLLILDEVTAGTDASNKRKIWNILQEYKKKNGVTILLTSHSMEEVEYLCDSIAILKKGKLHVSGTTLELKKHFEIGYTLSIVVKQQSEENTKEAIKGVVIQSVNHSKYLEESNAMNSNRLVFYLPNTSISQFANLLRQLDQRKQELQMEFYQLNANTLEEAFMKLDSNHNSGES